MRSRSTSKEKDHADIDGSCQLGLQWLPERLNLLSLAAMDYSGAIHLYIRLFPLLFERARFEGDDSGKDRCELRA